MEPPFTQLLRPILHFLSPHPTSKPRVNLIDSTFKIKAESTTSDYFFHGSSHHQVLLEHYNRLPTPVLILSLFCIQQPKWAICTLIVSPDSCKSPNGSLQRPWILAWPTDPSTLWPHQDFLTPSPMTLMFSLPHLHYILIFPWIYAPSPGPLPRRSVLLPGEVPYFLQEII